MSPQNKLAMLAVAQGLKDAEANWPTNLEIFAMLAKHLKAKFDALVEAGFTTEQAIELLKAKAL